MSLSGGPDESVRDGIVGNGGTEVDGSCSVSLGGNNVEGLVQGLGSSVVDLERSEDIVGIHNSSSLIGSDSQGNDSSNWLGVGKSIDVLLSSNIKGNSVIVKVSTSGSAVGGAAKWEDMELNWSSLEVLSGLNLVITHGESILEWHHMSSSQVEVEVISKGFKVLGRSSSWGGNTVGGSILGVINIAPQTLWEVEIGGVHISGL